MTQSPDIMRTKLPEVSILSALAGELTLKTKKASFKVGSFKLRLVITIIFSIAALLAVGYAFLLRQMRVPDMHIISFLLFGISAIVLNFMVLWTLGASKRFSRIAKVLRRIYMVCLSIGLIAFLVLQGLIISSAQTQEAEVDALIVLGAGLRNGAPSHVLRTRLDAAIDYVQTREGVPIIVSGGLGQGQTITEAQAMFNYLTSKGIDENLVWMEGASTSTYENLAFSRELMKERGLDVDNAKVAVVSNEFHLFRAKLIAENAGLEAVGVAAETPGWALKVLYFIREGFALANAILF